MISVLLLRNQYADIERLAHAVIAFGEVNNLPEEIVGDIRLALEEVVTNVMMHGYTDNAPHEIEIRFSAVPHRVSFTVIDDGQPFDPLSTARRDLEKGFDDGKIGGLGIHLYTQLMDTVSYQRLNDRNLLVMAKRIPGHRTSD
ncbi:MAG: ATP-binding protein [Pseudomonadota bacterium]